MKLSLALPVFVIAALFSGCSANDESNPLTEISTENGKLQQISIDKVPAEEKVVKLSKLISGFRIIPIETKPECMISNTKIVFAEDFFLVGTQNFPGAARLYRFDMEGKFINEIGRPGRGPGEHSGYMCDVIRVFDDNKTILVTWTGMEGPQLFDYNGDFVKEITLPYDLMSSIERWNDSLWFSVGSFAGEVTYARDSFALVFYNDDGKVLKKIPRRKYPEDISALTPNTWGHSLYEIDEELKLFMNGNDTIFNIDDNMEIKPAGLIISGKNALPFNKTIAPESFPGKEYYSILSETPNNWFLQKSIVESAQIRQFNGRWGGSFDMNARYIIIDKRSKKAVTATLEDDIFKIFPAELLNEYLSWQYDRLSIAVPPLNLAKMISELDESTLTDPDAIKAIQEIKKIPQDANPVIFLFTLKDRFRID